MTSSLRMASVLLLIACLSGKQVLWTTCLRMLWSLLWCKWSKGHYLSKVTSCRASHVQRINACTHGCTHKHTHPHWYLNYNSVSRAPISAGMTGLWPTVHTDTQCCTLHWLQCYFGFYVKSHNYTVYLSLYSPVFVVWPSTLLTIPFFILLVCAVHFLYPWYLSMCSFGCLMPVQQYW